MTTGTRHVRRITIVDISGQIVLGNESASVRDLIHDLLSKEHPQSLLNLGTVDYIDSVGLGSLVGAFTTVRKQAGELKRFNLPEKVAELMQVTKLYTVFDFLNDEGAAVKSISPSIATATARVAGHPLP